MRASGVRSALQLLPWQSNAKAASFVPTRSWASLHHGVSQRPREFAPGPPAPPMVWAARRSLASSSSSSPGGGAGGGEEDKPRKIRELTDEDRARQKKILEEKMAKIRARQQQQDAEAAAAPVSMSVDVPGAAPPPPPPPPPEEEQPFPPPPGPPEPAAQPASPQPRTPITLRSVAMGVARFLVRLPYLVRREYLAFKDWRSVVPKPERDFDFHDLKPFTPPPRPRPVASRRAKYLDWSRNQPRWSTTYLTDFDKSEAAKQRAEERLARLERLVDDWNPQDQFEEEWRRRMERARLGDLPGVIGQQREEERAQALIDAERQEEEKRNAPPTAEGTGPPAPTAEGTGPPAPTAEGTGPPAPTAEGTGPPPPTDGEAAPPQAQSQSQSQTQTQTPHTHAQGSGTASSPQAQPQAGPSAAAGSTSTGTATGASTGDATAESQSGAFGDAEPDAEASEPLDEAQKEEAAKAAAKAAADAEAAAAAEVVRLRREAIGPEAALKGPIASDTPDLRDYIERARQPPPPPYTGPTDLQPYRGWEKLKLWDYRFEKLREFFSSSPALKAVSDPVLNLVSDLKGLRADFLDVAKNAYNPRIRQLYWKRWMRKNVQDISHSERLRRQMVALDPNFTYQRFYDEMFFFFVPIVVEYWLHYDYKNLSKLCTDPAIDMIKYYHGADLPQLDQFNLALVPRVLDIRKMSTRMLMDETGLVEWDIFFHVKFVYWPTDLEGKVLTPSEVQDRITEPGTRWLVNQLLDSSDGTRIEWLMRPDMKNKHFDWKITAWREHAYHVNPDLGFNRRIRHKLHFDAIEEQRIKKQKVDLVDATLWNRRYADRSEQRRENFFRVGTRKERRSVRGLKPESTAVRDALRAVLEDRIAKAQKVDPAMAQRLQELLQRMSDAEQTVARARAEPVAELERLLEAQGGPRVLEVFRDRRAVVAKIIAQEVADKKASQAAKEQQAKASQDKAGTDGSQDKAGTDGSQDKAGTDGSQDEAGTDGKAGTDGSQDEAGTDGKAGTDGSQDKAGTQGSQDKAGTQGSQGKAGTQGSQESQGSDKSAKQGDRAPPPP